MRVADIHNTLRNGRRMLITEVFRYMDTAFAIQRCSYSVYNCINPTEMPLKSIHVGALIIDCHASVSKWGLLQCEMTDSDIEIHLFITAVRLCLFSTLVLRILLVAEGRNGDVYLNLVTCFITKVYHIYSTDIPFVFHRIWQRKSGQWKCWWLFNGRWPGQDAGLPLHYRSAGWRMHMAEGLWLWWGPALHPSQAEQGMTDYPDAGCFVSPDYTLLYILLLHIRRLVAWSSSVKNMSNFMIMWRCFESPKKWSIIDHHWCANVLGKKKKTCPVSSVKGAHKNAGGDLSMWCYTVLNVEQVENDFCWVKSTNFH